MVTHAAESTPTTSTDTQRPDVVQLSGRRPPTPPAVLTRSGSLAVIAIAPDQLTAAHVQAWEKLYVEQPNPSNPFLAVPWVLEWYDKFVRKQDRLVLVVHQDGGEKGLGDVVAIAAMHIQRPRVGPFALARRLLPVGAGLGPSAYELPGMLCRPGLSGQVMRALAAACEELTVDWSEISLTPEQGWFDNQWAYGSDKAMAFGEFVRPRACVVLRLQDTWDATKSQLKRNVKESIRRSANRLTKDARTVEIVRRGDDLDRDTVQRFLDLHQARASVSRSTQRHHPNSYADPRNSQLVLDALPQLSRRGQASMFELYLGGEHVASQLALHAPGTSYVHSSGFREDTWELGVITHLHAELIRYAIERGDTTVNFSPGPNVAKSRWSEQLWVTHEFAFGAGPRSLAVRFGAFQMLSSLRSTLDAAAHRRDQLKSVRS